MQLEPKNTNFSTPRALCGIDDVVLDQQIVANELAPGENCWHEFRRRARRQDDRIGPLPLEEGSHRLLPGQIELGAIRNRIRS